MNARFENKEEVEHHFDRKFDESSDEFEDEEFEQESFPVNIADKMEEHVETFEDMNGNLDDKFDVKGEADHYNEDECPDENSEEAAEDCGRNQNEEKEVVPVVTENDDEGLFVMKTVRIFRNKKYLQSKTFKIQENDLTSFGGKEILSEDEVNNDHDAMGNN